MQAVVERTGEMGRGPYRLTAAYTMTDALMKTTISAPLDARGLRFAIVAARFNEFITEKLISGATDALTRHGAEASGLSCVWVPGSYEIPLIAQKLASAGNVDAVICVGCVIRGQTPHFDYVAGECAKGIAHVSLATGVPVTFGVITADSLEQAIDRAGGKAGNKGADAALAAIEMANLMRMIGPAIGGRRAAGEAGATRRTR